MTKKLKKLEEILCMVNAINNATWNIRLNLEGAFECSEAAKSLMEDYLEKLSEENETIGALVVSEFHQEKMYQDYKPTEWKVLHEYLEDDMVEEYYDLK